MELKNENNNVVWFITGTSNGLGLNLVKNLLKLQNVKVVALTRRPLEIEKEIPIEQLSNLLISKSEITNESSVKESIKGAIEKFGKIDIVVNNAGYALVGSVEEISDEEMRKVFDVNFFGVLNVIRNVTPHFRERKTGTIFNISSICGSVNYSEFSGYQCTKHAINGLSYTLAEELKPFGIKVILISPSGFKSNFVNGGNMIISKNKINEYKTSERELWLDDIVNNARGDPDKFCNTLIKISKFENPSKNYYFGSFASELLKDWFKKQLNELEENIEISYSTDYDNVSIKH